MAQGKWHRRSGNTHLNCKFQIPSTKFQRNSNDQIPNGDLALVDY
jgi:hypothetical protein